jgi:hypothetical protein
VRPLFFGPLFFGLHAKREENGITIIGIHPAGANRGAIDKLLKDFKMEYPVCVDVKMDEDVHAWGEMYGAYHVDYIPYSVVVDGAGIVRGHGSLGEVLEIARKLAEPKESGK